MLFKLKSGAILTLALSAVLNMQAFADFNGGPGIGLPENVGETTETYDPYKYVPPAPDGGPGVSSGGDEYKGEENKGPGESLNEGPAEENTDPSITWEQGGVEADPVLGLVPEIHAQMLKTDGYLTDGFTSNMQAFSSPTDGFSALKLSLGGGIGDVFYRTYTAEHGWSQWAMNEMISTFYNDFAKVQAIQVRTKGYTRNLYDTYYQVTLNDGTVLDWAHDGQTAGAIGDGRYIQSIQFKLWKKDLPFARPTKNHMAAANYEGIIFDAEGKAHYSTYNGQPYTGWAYDTANNKYYFSNSEIVTGWQYIDGYKYYFDESGKVVTDLEPIIGITNDYKLKLNKSMKTLTVYAKDGDNGYIIPAKVILTTIGPATPIGTFKIYQKYRWKFMHDNIYCQYSSRFYNGFLLHSIIYEDEPDSYHLNAGTYNYHGKIQSDGCVRMLSGDAAWIFNNCKNGTEITIYEDEYIMGPFDRPAIEQAIPMDQNYDPTDPEIVAASKVDAVQ
ncbi:MAG: L,D-transpeptidase family protein [Eubacteriales bacterium]|nr:L,D-transpeptidase family protein [Eubacteriales bacterium]